MEITEIKIRKILNEERVKAIVSVVFDNVFAVHDMKIIEKKEDGTLFVAMPYRKTAQGKQLDIAHPINGAMRKTIEDSIIEKYREVLESGDYPGAGEHSTEASE